MKDVESQTTNKGGGTTTYTATFSSKSGTPFEKLMLTRKQHKQCKKEIVERKKNHA
jgi:hypothetical protein